MRPQDETSGPQGGKAKREHFPLNRDFLEGPGFGFWWLQNDSIACLLAEAHTNPIWRETTITASRFPQVIFNIHNEIA